MSDLKTWSPAQVLEHAEFKLSLLPHKDSLSCDFYRGVIASIKELQMTQSATEKSAVPSLVTESRAIECQTVVIPSIWKHYSCSKVAEIYERAMDEAGVKWRSVDDKPAITKRSQNNGDH
ncbi:hypothetical protein VU677_00435 [Hafnia paralvei]|uniref:hypothetical protein n=1 Tax=Hafnia paralvei TaxID=546367 RepID=UPI00300D37F2